VHKSGPAALSVQLAVGDKILAVEIKNNKVKI
jgi:hypothetical protein